MTSQQERRTRLVDRLEILALLVLPTILCAVGFYVLGGPGTVVPGIAIGGIAGFVLARVRRELHAYRTPEGVERRVRTAPEDTRWARLAAVEYAERYDRLLAVALFGIGITAFVAIPVVDPEDELRTLWLVLVGVFGLTTALATWGSLRL